MRTVVPYIIIGISLAGGILFYWRGCSSGPDAATTAAILRADSAERVLDSTKVADLLVIGRLKQDTAEKGRRLDTLMRQKAVLERSKAALSDMIRKTLLAGDTAGMRTDTGAIIRNWMALRGEVREIAPLVTATDSINNAVIAQCLDQGRVKDSIANRWEHLYRTADTTNALQRAALTKLHKDFDRQQFQVKIWKPVAIGGVVYVLFDIIKSSLKK